MYLLKFLRTSFRGKRAQLELYFIIFLGAVTVGAVIFLIPRIYRIRIIKVFLRELTEIVIETRKQAPEGLQSDGSVHDLLSMVLMVIIK